MSGKCRPSLRPKTLYNVDRSSLSTIDKECIHSVFELADHQKSEIEKNEKIIKAANDLIETQKAEIENLNTVNAEMQAEIGRMKNNAFCNVVIDEETMRNIVKEKVAEFELDIKSIKAEAVK